MPVKPCEHCGRGFTYEYGDEWKRTCLSCWKASKGAAGGASNYKAKLAAEYDRGWADGFAHANWQNRRMTTSQPAIPDDVIKRIRILCHPDKHNNSEMATKVTQWVNEVMRA